MITDDTELPELTRRQEEILSLIIQSYTHSPEPVSSKYLVEAYQLNFSTATVRNEMAVLEEKGYVKAPHTSAGRVPTEDGYRYFVKRLLTITELSAGEQNSITHKLQASPLATEQWMRLAATVMSRTARSAALVTPPIAEINRFKHMELIAIQGRLVLMVLVLHSGNVLQQMLTLNDPVPQNTLSETAQRINLLCQNLTANEVRMKGVQLQLLERDMADLAAEIMERADTNQVRLVYRDGLSETIAAFHGGQGAQQVVRVFEERAFLNMILSEVLNAPDNRVQIFIAGEGRWEELKHLSMVLSRYGIPGQASGAVGVIGPTHINYNRAVSTVRYVSNLMTDMLNDLYREGDDTLPVLTEGDSEE